MADTGATPNRTAPCGSATRLLHAPGESDGAGQTFAAVLDAIAQAQRTVAMHMYVWRSDEIGNAVGEALLAAAARGVKIHIIKDLGAMMFERIEMNRKSYLPRKPGWSKKLWWGTIRPTFPKTYTEDKFRNGAGQALAGHENVTITWAEGTHTHTKYYLIDDRKLITGSINIEDRHRQYFDYMVALEGDSLGERFRARESGTLAPDFDRDIEFVFNQTMGGEERFEIKPLLIDLLIRERGLVADFMAVADARREAGKLVESPMILGNYNHALAALQELHQKLKL